MQNFGLQKQIFLYSENVEKMMMLLFNFFVGDNWSISLEIIRCMCSENSGKLQHLLLVSSMWEIQINGGEISLEFLT